LLAVLDQSADGDMRLDGALLVVDALNDLSLLRRIFLKQNGE
jgi:hypothetical protein